MFANFKKWEYWPASLFYIPLLPYAFYLALKARSFGFFSATNPAIEGSGNGLESKYAILKLFPSKYCPKTILVKPFTPYQHIKNQIEQLGIIYPLIVKPDVGFRGLLVKKINTKKELQKYLKNYNSISLLIQEYIALPKECGIFYHKIPTQKKGKITSITLKKFLEVTGDGKATLLSLITNHKRAKNYLNLLKKNYGKELNSVVKKNETIMLSCIGNHAKGTQFINGNHLISKELTAFFDTLQKDISGWNYGRLDIKYNTFEELKQGKNLKILELNGIISEPTHIYDTTKSNYFNALKEIKKHWKLIYTIASANKKLNKGKYTDLKYLLNLNKTYQMYLAKITKLS